MGRGWGVVVRHYLHWRIQKVCFVRCGGHTLQKVSSTSKNSSDFASLCTIERFERNLPA